MNSKITIKSTGKKSTLVLLCLITLHITLQWRYLFLDFWSDELYTLEQFVFVPFLQTITDYHLPNNHVLFSLLLSIFVKLFGIQDINELLMKPWILRSLMLVISTSSLVFTYKAANRIQKSSGNWVVMILVFTLPFLNFALQIRGYSLSILLISALIYFVARFNAKQKVSVGIISLSALLAYTIPSNYYFLIALIVGAALLYLKNRDKKWVFIGLNLSAGVFVSLLLFAPVFTDVFSNRFVASAEPFSLTHLHMIFPWILKDMVGGRYILLAITLVALVLTLKKPGQARPWIVFLLATAFVPFVVSFVRGDLPFMRSFVPMVVPLALIAGIGIHQLLDEVPRLKNAKIALFMLLGFEGWFAFQNNWIESETECLYNIEHVHHAEDLGTCYFQHHYQPLEDVKHFAALNPNLENPIFIHRCQPHDIRFYLNLYGFTNQYHPDFDSLTMHSTHFYAISENPNELVEIVKNANPDLEAHVINRELTYHTFVEFSSN